MVLPEDCIHLLHHITLFDKFKNANDVAGRGRYMFTTTHWPKRGSNGSDIMYAGSKSTEMIAANGSGLIE